MYPGPKHFFFKEGFMKRQNNRMYVAVLTFIIPVVFTLSSCTDVFSTSWGSALKRDPDKLIPQVTSSNVEELLDASLGDPDFATILLGKINDSVKTAKGGEKAALQDAGLKAAANASGLATSILDNAGTLLTSGKGSSKDIQNTVDGILRDMNGENLQQIAGDLRTILDDESTYKKNSKAPDEDLAVAAVVLLLADAKKAENLDEYLDAFADRKESLTLTSNEKKALFLAETLAKKHTDNEIINELLDAMKLGTK
jgi:hypothetical protein